MTKENGNGEIEKHWCCVLSLAENILFRFPYVPIVSAELPSEVWTVFNAPHAVPVLMSTVVLLQSENKTALHISVANKDEALVSYLTSNTAKFDIPDNVSY